MITEKKLIEEIKKEMKHQGISTEKLAANIGVSPKSLFNAFNGANSMRLCTYVKLKNMLKIK